MKRACKSILIVLVLLSVQLIAQAQGAHPGGDDGLPTPVDGGILMGLLAIGSVAIGLLKKNKK